MNRTELVKATAVQAGVDTKTVDKVLRGTVEVITSVTSKAEPVTISGFAKFARVDRPARMARNPATGAPVKVKASKKAKITPLKAYKDALLAPSTAPKLVKGAWPLIPVTKAGAARKAPAKATSTRAVAKATPARTSTRAVAKATPARTSTRAPAKRVAATKTATPARRAAKR